MGMLSGKLLTLGIQRSIQWIRQYWQQIRDRYIWLSKISSWFCELVTLIYQSRAFQFAVFLYVIISLLQTCHQRAYAPTSQIELLRFAGEPFALCVRYPTFLTLDGDTRQGMVTLHLIDDVADGVCPKKQPGLLRQFIDRWSRQPSPATETPSPTATLSVTTTQAATAIVAAAPVISSAVTTTPSASTNTGITQRPVSATLTTIAMMPTLTITATPTTLDDSVITQTGQPGIMNNLSTTPFPLTPYHFKLVAVDDLLFIDQEGIAYSPEITLTLEQEQSVIIAHAQLKSSKSENSFSVKHVESNTTSKPARTIGLERYWGALWWRKLGYILLAPATGGLLALVAIWLEEARKRDEIKREQEKEEKKQQEEQKKAEDIYRKEVEQRNRDKQKTELKIFCEQIIHKLEKPREGEVLLITQQWLDWIERILDELKSDLEVQEGLQKSGNAVIKNYVLFAKPQLPKLKNMDSEESKTQKRVANLLQNDWAVYPDLKRQFNDLEFVTEYLRGAKLAEAHRFTDAGLAGFYANLRWSERADRKIVSDELEYLQKQAENEPKIYKNIFLGIFTYEQPFSPDPFTLLQELGDDYVTVKYQEFYQYTNIYPWWHELVKVIDTIDHTETEFARWCQGKREEKIRYERNQQWIRRGLPPRRALWPLELSESAPPIPDANYDFSFQEIDNLGTQSVYSFKDVFTLEDNGPKEPIDAFKLCADYLSKRPHHHIVTGKRGAGKTWLRLCLEYYCLVTESQLLPVFYFAPGFLVYKADQSTIVRSLACSVANQLFADLLISSSGHTSSVERWQTSRNTIAPFFKAYGYEVPSAEAALTQPAPASHLLDIDLAYGTSYLRDLYAQMKQAIEGLPEQPINPEGFLPEDMLDDIQRAMELANYRDMFILVDNWDNLPDAPRNRLLSHLLEPNLLTQLQERNLFLKIFVPSIDENLIKDFQKTCIIERTDKAHNRHQLVLYTHP